MSKVKGLEQAMKNLNEKIRKAAKDADVELVVGYNAPYALIVHEDEDMPHQNGQAKFLQQPAVENAKTYGQIVVENRKAGKTMRQSIIAAGTQLKLDSQELVPVDTGELKGSAYIRVDVGRAAKAVRGAKGKRGRSRRKTQHG